MPKQYAGNPKYNVDQIKVGIIVKGRYGVHPVMGRVIKIAHNYDYDEKVFKTECKDEQGTSYPWLRLYEIEEIV